MDRVDGVGERGPGATAGASRQGSIRGGRSSPIAGTSSARTAKRGQFRQWTSRLEVARKSLTCPAHDRGALRPSVPIPTSPLTILIPAPAIKGGAAASLPMIPGSC
ncbi:MAG: hypothetical protein JO252_10500 [Planctomycetaceae bacterium]|nr:hypothetical protein [Planctomycetaceae bacterium]